MGKPDEEVRSVRRETNTDEKGSRMEELRKEDYKVQETEAGEKEARPGK